jgi:hypothetical protein
MSCLLFGRPASVKHWKGLVLLLFFLSAVRLKGPVLSLFFLLQVELWLLCDAGGF